MIDYHILICALALMILDIVTGFSQAIKNREVSSTVMRNGLFHKLGFICAIALSAVCEYAMIYVDLGFTVPLVPAVCGFIMLTEVVSILENIKQLTPELGSNEFLKIFNNDVK